MAEDCLYLNVITPNVSLDNVIDFQKYTHFHITGNYPVMVYIHGGTFTTGGADIYHWKVGRTLDLQRPKVKDKRSKIQGAIRNLVSHGVVVVTIQYRLGMIGFFTTFTERFPPNRGMYDQV